MKQSVLCLTCRDDMKKLHGNSSEPHIGEYLRYVDGRAMRLFRCDHCGIKIKALDLCCAYSISTKDAPYFSWEHEYIIFKRR